MELPEYLLSSRLGHFFLRRCPAASYETSEWTVKETKRNHLWSKKGRESEYSADDRLGDLFLSDMNRDM